MKYRPWKGLLLWFAPSMIALIAGVPRGYVAVICWFSFLATWIWAMNGREQ